MPAHNFLDNLIFIDGHVHRLANPNIGHRAARLIAECQKDGAPGRTADHFQLRILNNLIEKFHRNAGHQLSLS